jgi:hypothetical protein
MSRCFLDEADDDQSNRLCGLPSFFCLFVHSTHSVLTTLILSLTFVSSMY